MADAGAFLLTFMVERLFFVNHLRFETLLATACMNLLGALMMRMFYRYAFKCGNDTTRLGKFLFFLLKLFGGKGIVGERTLDATKIRIAIIGACLLYTSDTARMPEEVELEINARTNQDLLKHLLR